MEQSIPLIFDHTIAANTSLDLSAFPLDREQPLALDWQAPPDNYDPPGLHSLVLGTTDFTAFALARSGKFLDSRDIYVITSTDKALDELSLQLKESGAQTIQLGADSSLANLIALLNDRAPDSGFRAVHLLGHGSAGQLVIGKDTLSSRNLWRHKQELNQLGGLISNLITQLTPHRAGWAYRVVRKY